MNSNDFRIYVGIPSLTSIDRKTVEMEKQQRLKIIHVIEKQQRLKSRSTSVDRKSVEMEKQQRLKIIHVIEKQLRLKLSQRLKSN